MTDSSLTATQHIDSNVKTTSIDLSYTHTHTHTHAHTHTHLHTHVSFNTNQLYLIYRKLIYTARVLHITPKVARRATHKI